MKFEIQNLVFDLEIRNSPNLVVYLVLKVFIVSISFLAHLPFSGLFVVGKARNPRARYHSSSKPGYPCGHRRSKPHLRAAIGEFSHRGLTQNLKHCKFQNLLVQMRNFCGVAGRNFYEVTALGEAHDGIASRHFDFHSQAFGFLLRHSLGSPFPFLIDRWGGGPGDNVVSN